MGRSGHKPDLRAVMRSRLAPNAPVPASSPAPEAAAGEQLPRPVYAFDGVQVIPPYVSVQRAVDSDRGEIDVDGDPGEGESYIDVGRFEKEEYEQALSLAEQEAARRGAFLIDELAGTVSDRYVPVELKATLERAIAADKARRAAEEEARRVKQGDEVWVPGGGGPTAIVESVDEAGIATCVRKDTGERFERAASRLAKARR